MPGGRYGAVIRQLNCLFVGGTVAGMDDRLLLERFVACRDEAAFEALVARFGPMVLGICRRRLHDGHDVEDAFQATFLILVSKAATIRDRDNLGNWLYGVAYRVAARARANARRRRSREVAGAEEALAPQQPHAGEGHELAAVLDEELSRLPEKYRLPLVLCNFQGETYEEAARRLNCPIGTVRSRTAKARELMRSRLVRRGIAPTASVLSAALTPAATRAAIPPDLVEATTAAARVVAEKATAGVVSASVVDLTRGVLRAMFFTKLRTVAVTVLAIVTTATGVGVVARQVAATPPPGQHSADPTGPGGRAAEGAASPAGTRAPAAGDQGRTKDYSSDRVESLDANTLTTERTRSGDREDDSLDYVESLRAEIDLLSIEVNLVRDIITDLTKEMAVQSGVPASPIQGPRQQAELVRREARLKQSEQRLGESRDEYLAKSKKLGFKRRELDELERKIRARIERTAPRRPISSDTPRISTALEERLSEMDKKLERIIKALEGPKNDQRQ